MMNVFARLLQRIEYSLMFVRQMLQGGCDLSQFASQFALQFFDVFGMTPRFRAKIENVAREIEKFLSHR